MTKRTLSFGFLAMTIILFTFSCEKRFLDIPHEPATESQVELLKAYFENYSRNLPPPDSQNFARLARSGSERTLHWDRAETIGDPEMGILRIPVSYTGQQTFIQDSAGEKHPLGDNTWLVARPRKEGGYKLNLVTYLPLEQTTQQDENPYTAVLEVGDWQGRHEFAVLYRKQGSPVMVKNRVTDASSNTPSKQTLRMAVDNSGSYVCVQTGTLCVAVYVEGTENYDNTIWSCRGLFKCYFADGTSFDPEEYPDFDLPEIWYGGGVPVPPAPSIPENAQIPGQDNPAINPQDFIDCFSTINDANATYKVTVYVQEPTPGSNTHFGVNSVGHAAIGLTKTGSNGQSITQVLGFYPQGEKIFEKFTAPSKVVNNGDVDDLMQYTVKMDFNMGGNGTDFQNILDIVGNPPAQYHAFESNCVKYVLDACTAGGLSVPFNLSTVYAFVPANPAVPTGMITAIAAYTPSGMAQAMRNAKNQGDNRVNTANNAQVDKSKGPC